MKPETREILTRITGQELFDDITIATADRVERCYDAMGHDIYHINAGMQILALAGWRVNGRGQWVSPDGALAEDATEDPAIETTEPITSNDTEPEFDGFEGDYDAPRHEPTDEDRIPYEEDENGFHKIRVMHNNQRKTVTKTAERADKVRITFANGKSKFIPLTDVIYDPVQTAEPAEA